MSTQIPPYPLRLDKEILNKLKIIAKENGRSLNKEIEYLAKKHINEYEKDNGIIEVEQDK